MKGTSTHYILLYIASYSHRDLSSQRMSLFAYSGRLSEEDPWLLAKHFVQALILSV